MKYFYDLKCGWANLTLGDCVLKCSYIQNIPLTILKAWDDFKRNKYCIISIDHEGYESELVITENGIHIIKYHNFVYYTNLNEYFITLADKVKLLQDLVIDIISNIDEWAEWLCLTDPNMDCYESVVNEYKKEILEYADKIGIEYSVDLL